MKLNPPETAPKDRIILAAFDPHPEFHATAWNSRYASWDFTFSAYVAGSPPTTRMLIDSTTRKMRGWLPLPTLDTE